MRKFENLLIVFIILFLAMGSWLLYYSQKVDYNYSLTKMLVDRDRANVEIVGVLLDRLSRLEEKYEKSTTSEEYPTHKLDMIFFKKNERKKCDQILNCGKNLGDLGFQRSPDCRSLPQSERSLLGQDYLKKWLPISKISLCPALKIGECQLMPGEGRNSFFIIIKNWAFKFRF